MATWNIEITKTKDAQFPWKAAVVSSNGKRHEVGEFLHEKAARNYAAMELNLLAGKEKPAPADLPHPQAA